MHRDVLSARRTFWEKATALQAEAHRPKDSPTPQYFSRHYYDIAMLLDTEDGKAAAADFELLAQVAKHKAVFFRSGWASYDTARPGTLQMMPSEARQNDLRADYRDMAPMMFDDKPLSFDDILARVQKLQDTINASTSGPQQPAPPTAPRHAYSWWTVSAARIKAPHVARVRGRSAAESSREDSPAFRRGLCVGAVSPGWGGTR